MAKSRHHRPATSWPGTVALPTADGLPRLALGERQLGSMLRVAPAPGGAAGQRPTLEGSQGKSRKVMGNWRKVTSFRENLSSS